MESSNGAWVVLYIILVLLPGAWAGNEPKVDPQTGLIRILFIGDSLMEAGHITPFLYQDPIVALTRVPIYITTDLDERLLRLYFPRHQRQIYEGYDVIILGDVGVMFFPPKVQSWIKNGVIEHGLGFLMGGGPQSFGGFGPWEHPSYEGSLIGDVLPVICLRDWTYDLGDRFWLVPSPGYEDHPLMRNIPWKQVPLFCRNRVLPKEGSVVVGVSNQNPPGSPILTFMDMGEGMSEAFVFDWGGNGPKEFHRWDYAPVVTSNLVYQVARVAIPEDTTLIMRLRKQLIRYFSMRRYVISVIDFADKFGANLRRAEKALSDSDDDRKQVIGLYLDGDHQESLARLESALANLDVVTDLALRAKDEALLWVYVIEWFA
ncbi:MAG: hypothetical protein HXS50_03025, partial [Theionarchaea archaeon]|nr:hypothetical protein [Theionarchaea archaeon]